MIKFIFLLFFGYLFYKTIHFLKGLFFNERSNNDYYKVNEPNRTRTKIDQKDVIDAQFEEIEINENSSSKN